MLPETDPAFAPETAEDLCALSLVRRVAALLDRDPAGFAEGDPLPRGWHVLLFAPTTPQSALGADGFDPPPPGLAGMLGLERPRLMLGGRRTRYGGDLTIGGRVSRARRLLSVTPKQGRSGRLVIVSRRQEIYAAGAPHPAVVEEEDLVYREAAAGGAPEAPPAAGAAGPPAPHSRRLVPDEALVFRYSMATFNAHRIHYDHPYATGVEGYPALVVNGGLTALLLLELWRSVARGPLAETSVRGLRPLFVGRPATLKALPDGAGWRLWAENEAGAPAMEMQAR